MFDSRHHSQCFECVRAVVVRLFEEATDVKMQAFCPDFILIRFLKPADGARQTSDEVSPAVFIHWNTAARLSVSADVQTRVQH